MIEMSALRRQLIAENEALRNALQTLAEGESRRVV